MTPSRPDPVRWLDEEEQAAWRSLVAMSAQLATRLNRALLEDAGLSLQDYAVLVALSESPSGRMRAFELSGVLGWEKSRLSHHLSRMAAHGLVRRESCPSDQRGTFVTLTGEGRDALTRAAPGHVDAVRRLFADRLTRSQLRTLRAIGSTVLEGLAQDCGGDPGS